jgi:HAD superfamily hydrolase (TIGR01484 family)
MKFFLDMDGTICESKQPITKEVKKALHKLKSDIVIISGASKKQMRKQLGKNITKYILGQSGAEYFKLKLTAKDKADVYAHLAKIKRYFPHYFKDENDLIEDRGSQITLSFIGHNADIEKKRVFDRGGLWRQGVLNTIPFKSELLEVRVAGTTCLDYTNKGFTKGQSILKFIIQKDWNRDECIYFGDALFKGGNDESVKGIIKTVEVENPQDLILKLKEYV